MRSKLWLLAKSPPKYLIAAFGLIAACLLVYVVVFYHRPVQFSYAGSSCFRDVTILPKLFKVKGDGTYELGFANAKSLGGYPVVSTVSCVSASQSPQEKTTNKVQLTLLGIPVPNKKFAVVTDEYPQLDTAVLGEKISIRDPLKFTLNKPDKIFTYHLVSGSERTVCSTDEEMVSCDIASLKLQQNQSYNLSVERYFTGELQNKVAEKTVTTVEPVVITETSVIPGGIVYDKPTSFTLRTNKALKSANVVFKSSGVEVPHEILVNGTEIVLTLAQPIARNTNFEITVVDALAEDKGVLFQPYQLSFKSSGGPRVAGVNIGHSSVEPGQTVVVTFDQTLAPNQDINSLVTMISGASSVAFRSSLQGRQLLITPTSPLSLCSAFSVKVSTDVINQYGVGGDSAWSISSRNRCYTVSTIGYSAQGRAISAWRFGSGAVKYVYLGTTHGDERSTKYLLDRWIQELDANYGQVPADRTIIVIPSINPDGFAAGSRRNANNVDLNRNFPAYDWKKDVTMPGGQLVVNGGGTSALSEPESQAIANFIQSEKPRLLLTYHSVAWIVSGNSTGDSDALAVRYANLSGYNYLAFGEEDTVFHYDTTGALENWLHDAVGIPAILVELGSHTNHEFSRNRSAMWSMLQ